MTLNSVSRIVFVEDDFQALWVRKNVQVNQQIKLIALTAQAVLALEKAGLPFIPISRVADTRLIAAAERQYSFDCFNMLSNIEEWILEKYPPVSLIGPGFLTGQAYYVQMSIGGIGMRAFLMREALRAFSPVSVSIFDDGIDEWFDGDGYERNPWIETFHDMSAEYHFQIEIIPLPKPRARGSVPKIRNVYLQLRSRLIEWIKAAITLLRRMRLKSKKDGNAARLLFADAQSYDWDPVLNALRNDPSFSLSFLKSAYVPGRGWWAHYYQDAVYDEFLSRGLPLKNRPIHFCKSEQDDLSRLLDEWIITYPERATMNLLGMELFPALLPHLRSMLFLSVPLMRYANELAIKVLDVIKPDAVCFNSMTWLSSISLALQANQRSIPVVSYQHGGSYGVQKVPTHDFAEFAHSDYFLNYGAGVHPPDKPVIPTKAKFIPVGSALIESVLKNASAIQENTQAIKVLWIGEVSLSNTTGGAWLVEDTSRFLLEKQSLEILDTNHINVMYRPFPYNQDALATPQWLSQARLPAVHLDRERSLKKSIQGCDLVICDSSSSTTWNEVLALGKPLLLYCDPDQTVLMDHFAADLEKACYWCRSVPEFLDAMQRLAKEPKELLYELRQKPTDDYLRKYVLHEGNSVAHVISFLSKVCSKELKRG